MSEQPDGYNDGRSILFDVDKVKVDREARQRRTLDKDIKILAGQIAAAGRLIHPITIRKDGTLVAGERRLEAHKLLEWPQIRAQIFEELPYDKAYLIELLENIGRRQLSWQDEVTAVSKYHKMRLQVTGGIWTLRGTATDLNFSETSVRKYLTIADQLSDDEVYGAATMEGAWNLIRGRADRAQAAARSRGLDIASVVKLPSIDPAATPAERGVALSELIKISGIEPRPKEETNEADFANIEAGRLAAESLRRSAELERAAQDQSSSPIITGDFLEWVEAYSGPQFDVLHVDFPYGKDYAGSNTRRTGRAHIAPTYSDSADIMWELLEALITWQDKIAYPVAHMIYWFDMEFYCGVKETLANAGWTLAQPHPLIWHKPAQGVASDVKRRPRHTYETALLLSRGDRKLVRLEQDVNVSRVDEKLHINQKAVEPLTQFLSMIVDEHTAVLDPTCGSGSALAAARKLHASRVLGIELDATNAEVARFVLAREDKNDG